ncbi:MAG: ATP-binding protein [Candidatus Woesearchaeota archaeon]
MKSIVVLSGKGGVGKSSITASLAVALSKEKNIVCADCDVDASNLSLLFALSEDKYEEWIPLSTNQTAIVDQKECIGCGKCIDTCYFDALKLKDNIPVVNEFGCEGCGACELICPVDAIKLKNIDNAHIGHAKTRYGFSIASAQLEPGNSGSGKVVAEIKKKAKKISPNADMIIVDASAGIGCPVIASVTGNDYAIIVTEPTPSGFSDLKKALEVVNHFKIKKGIVINKSDLNEEHTEKICNFAEENQIKILEKIPFDKDFVHAMNAMVPVIDYNKKYEIIFDDIKKEAMTELTEQN